MITIKFEIIKELHTDNYINTINTRKISLENNVNIINQAKKVTF